MDCTFHKRRLCSCSQATRECSVEERFGGVPLKLAEFLVQVEQLMFHGPKNDGGQIYLPFLNEPTPWWKVSRELPISLELSLTIDAHVESAR